MFKRVSFKLFVNLNNVSIFHGEPTQSADIQGLRGWPTIHQSSRCQLCALSVQTYRGSFTSGIFSPFKCINSIAACHMLTCSSGATAVCKKINNSSLFVSTAKYENVEGKTG